MHVNSSYIAPQSEYLYRDYFKAEVSTTWAHGPLGLGITMQKESRQPETHGTAKLTQKARNPEA